MKGSLQHGDVERWTCSLVSCSPCCFIHLIPCTLVLCEKVFHLSLPSFLVFLFSPRVFHSFRSERMARSLREAHFMMERKTDTSISRPVLSCDVLFYAWRRIEGHLKVFVVSITLRRQNNRKWTEYKSGMTERNNWTTTVKQSSSILDGRCCWWCLLLSGNPFC